MPLIINQQESQIGESTLSGKLVPRDAHRGPVPSFITSHQSAGITNWNPTFDCLVPIGDSPRCLWGFQRLACHIQTLCEYCIVSKCGLLRKVVVVVMVLLARFNNLNKKNPPTGTKPRVKFKCFMVQEHGSTLYSNAPWYNNMVQPATTLLRKLSPPIKGARLQLNPFC